MLGQKIIDIKDNNKEKMLIKIGMSRDVDKRMSNYRCDNPSALLISTTAGVEREESYYHHQLYRLGMKKYGGEWFEVSEEFFTQCLKTGFNTFKMHKKQNVYMHIKYAIEN